LSQGAYSKCAAATFLECKFVNERQSDKAFYVGCTKGKIRNAKSKGVSPSDSELPAGGAMETQERDGRRAISFQNNHGGRGDLWGGDVGGLGEKVGGQ